MPSGGDLIADVLARQRVSHVFTLCGGHISPILVAARAHGIRVVDVRDEATAVFAADAVARLTGIPGVAAVTAGPGATNSITAIKNAQLARSPIVVLGGATATILKGRGSLQDIDQLALIGPHVKWIRSVRTVRSLPRLLEQAFVEARSSIPGPVFLECPVDLLYAEDVVRNWYGVAADKQPRSIGSRLERWYLARHLNRLFRGVPAARPAAPVRPAPRPPERRAVGDALTLLNRADRPVVLVGSQALESAAEVAPIVDALSRLGAPVYLAGMARGLLGATHPLQLRHHRREALREADVVVLAGTPCDFRLEYGRQINRHAAVIAVNRARAELRRNRRPALAIEADPPLLLCGLAEARPQAARWTAWLEALRQRDADRDRAIVAQAEARTEFVNPLRLHREIDRILPDDSTIVADGGDFVAAASYIIRPRKPLSWLDPGVFGTLGAGAGFAVGSALCRPSEETWLLLGDGAAGFSLMEFDTLVRHRIPLVAVVGNDACWTQIAREQVELLKDDVGTALRRTDYHTVAEGLGGKGLLLDADERIAGTLECARSLARAGHPVLVNVLIGGTEFRKGAISM
ncbi:MAG: thiamine pyrophosphate-binding protein [Acidobacteria bacterium]|nr:thiamine pyrophosphate-binding protein [Acidobacteriota bacterium]